MSGVGRSRATDKVCPKHSRACRAQFWIAAGTTTVQRFSWPRAPNRWVNSKLMRSNRGQTKIRSKSYSNRLLIDFFDPNSAVKSIVATSSIRNLGPNLNLTLNLIENWSNLFEFEANLPILEVFGSNSTNFRYNLTNFDYIIDIVLI